MIQDPKVLNEVEIDHGTFAIFQSLVHRSNQCKQMLENADKEFQISKNIIDIYMKQVCDKLGIEAKDFTLYLDQRKFIRK